RSSLPPPSFQVTAHSPLLGAVDVGSTVRPQVFFSRPVDPASLNSGDFYASISGQKLPATIVPSDSGMFAWLFLKDPMPSSAAITVTVDGSAIRALGTGQALDAQSNGRAGSALQFSFNTVSLAALPGTSLSGVVVDPGPDLIPRTDDDLDAGLD